MPTNVIPISSPLEYPSRTDRAVGQCHGHRIIRFPLAVWAARRQRIAAALDHAALIAESVSDFMETACNIVPPANVAITYPDHEIIHVKWNGRQPAIREAFTLCLSNLGIMHTTHGNIVCATVSGPHGTVALDLVSGSLETIFATMLVDPLATLTAA